MKVRAHIHVSGFVQGVFFRYRTSMMARELNVNGWIRNLRDGRVEAIFEGEKESVDEMIRYCGRGPAGAIVRNVDLSWEDYTGEYPNFAIRSTRWSND